MAREYLVNKLQQLNYYKIAAQTTIQLYYLEITEYNKHQILLKFQKLEHASKIQIILATNVIKISVNNSNIKQVVQFRMAKSMCSLN